MSRGVLSIGELARRAGVSESTLRAWEQRYGFLEPERTPGGHRRYRLDDLATVQRLLELTGSGFSVGAAVGQLQDVAESPGGASDDAEVQPVPQADVDGLALTLAYRTSLRLLELRQPADATPVLVELVTALGGQVVPATEADEDALPVDLSFGYGEPVLPAAAPLSLARMRLEFVLPQLVEGARHVVDLLRAQDATRG